MAKKDTKAQQVVEAPAAPATKDSAPRISLVEYDRHSLRTSVALRGAFLRWAEIQGWDKKPGATLAEWSARFESFANRPVPSPGK